MASFASKLLRILIVDDDAQVRFVTTRLLRSRGHSVEERGDAIGTAQHMAQFRPDVVLLDVTMPGLAGDVLAGMLRRRAGQEIIILFSALPEHELAILTRNCGAAGYVCKHDPATLISRIEAIIESAGSSA